MVNGKTRNRGEKLVGICLTVVVAAGCAQPPPVDLSPASWPAGEVEKYYGLLEFNPDSEGELATSDSGVVVGTTGGPALRAGLEALAQGGSAVDAALTTSLAQVNLAAGSWVSYAGIFTMVYFDAASGHVYSLNAGYNTVQDETDPLTIPKITRNTSQDVAGTDAGEPSGRTALVPGYMAGVEAAHQRFGKLPWSQLFEPAIYFAEQGYPVSTALSGMIEGRQDVLSRLPETKAVFTKEDGSWFAEGDLFTQPAVAATLGKVAEQGADYMYTGEWAQRLVDAVQTDGGKMTMKDLADYEVIWGEPLHTNYNGSDVYIYGLPAKGGVGTVQALNLLEAAGMKEMGHYQQDPDAFVWFARAGAHWILSYIPEQSIANLVPGLDMSFDGMLKEETAQELVRRYEENPDFLKEAVQPLIQAMMAEQGTNHSDGVVAVDRWGNMAALVHSINTVTWGRTGIIVDGVSIPDSAAIQTDAVAAAGPGNRLPDPATPLVVVKDGRAVLGLSTIGANLGVDMLKTITNVVDYGMDMREAIFVPELFSTGGLMGGPEVILIEGEYPEEFVEAVKERGMEVMEIPPYYRGNSNGGSFVVGIERDPVTGMYRGSTTTKTGGMALAVAE